MLDNPDKILRSQRRPHHHFECHQSRFHMARLYLLLVHNYRRPSLYHSQSHMQYMARRNLLILHLDSVSHLSNSHKTDSPDTSPHSQRLLHRHFECHQNKFHKAPLYLLLVHNYRHPNLYHSQSHKRYKVRHNPLIPHLDF